jgi:hypothetical protein
MAICLPMPLEAPTTRATGFGDLVMTTDHEDRTDKIPSPITPAEITINFQAAAP